MIINGLLDYAGDIGPFQLAIALTVLSMFIIFFWRENYGHCDPEEGERLITIFLAVFV